MNNTRKEGQNSLTPVEVILLDKKFKKLLAACSTTLQRGNLRQEVPYVQWEVEVLDVNDSYLSAIVRLRDPWSWWRGNEYDGEMSLTAYLNHSNLREHLLKLERGQRVRVEGPVNYSARHFYMDPAKLIM